MLMAEFAAFVCRLLESGEARLRAAPPEADESPAAIDCLAAAFADAALDVAGPPIPFVPETAVAAARFLAWSCWFLMDRRESPDEVAARLLMPPPASPGDHLSADLTLRFAATVLRRARLASPTDVLTRRLEETLRRWPLSGALADIADAPDELGTHPGLLLLQAERLALRPRPAWLVGAVAPYVELVFARRGLPLITRETA
jgi:hypothetical protein